MKLVRAIVAGVAIAASWCFPSSSAAAQPANGQPICDSAARSVRAAKLFTPHALEEPFCVPARGAGVDGSAQRPLTSTPAYALHFECSSTQCRASSHRRSMLPDWSERDDESKQRRVDVRPAVTHRTAALLTKVHRVVTVGSHGRESRSSVEQHGPSAEFAQRTAQLAVVQKYLQFLRHEAYTSAYGLLNAAERRYYRDAGNFASVYAADAYHISTFKTVGDRDDPRIGRVFFMRETARFRDHAHDADLSVTATVPLGVVDDNGSWRIKDPGHPWRAFAAQATAASQGVRLSIKKMSFFARRTEAVLTFTNLGAGSVTILAYGKTVLHDADGRAFRLIETRDWSLTDKQLFEGLRLASGAQYTGTLAFACQPFENAARRFSLSIGPLLRDGADAPFSIDVEPVVGIPSGNE